MIYLMNLISQVTEVPNEDVLKSLLDLIGGVKGGSALAISILVTQFLMKLFSSGLANFAGKYKLLIVYGLSVVFTVLSALVLGGGFTAAVMNGSVLAAVQVFGFEVYSQFFKKEK